MEIIFTLDEIDSVAKRILNNEPAKVLLFEGSMGAGKTTLIKAFCRALEVDDTTGSPTFSLVNEYHSEKNGIIYHFDFYRIKDDTEALDMGVEEYFSSGNWCFVEWPAKIVDMIPAQHEVIKIIEQPDGRRQLTFRK
ncbi:MAG TPA: tRNA (adenosine(37)-N6)-threonylcarbamoyltransferase complex ATPase subunit type 1 TsaE [Flavobacterium sp.]|jgi:tRNA threonylcarbamoyladenosine biosynthesis protein TsaE